MYILQKWYFFEYLLHLEIIIFTYSYSKTWRWYLFFINFSCYNIFCRFSLFQLFNSKCVCHNFETTVLILYTTQTFKSRTGRDKNWNVSFTRIVPVDRNRSMYIILKSLKTMINHRIRKNIHTQLPKLNPHLLEFLKHLSLIVI